MKTRQVLPIVLMIVFALTRIPGVLPENFSAVYGLLFCCGVYMTGRMAWWLPLATMAVTDIGLNLYYQLALDVDAFKPYLLFNYAAYVVLIWLGRRFTARASWLALLGGGIMGAILFYLITNTAAWFFNPFGNPEYTKDLTGWIIALTRGTAGYPATVEFFRNTLLSGGLFTGLFAGAMKLFAAPEEQESEEEEPAEEPAESPAPEPTDANG
ncbi:MAG TPA: hypothetical protein PLW35_10505 [Verrucomicrobiota bacterium]|nr:hypothetical protein [Verrucomicrobiota bacterium]HOK78137.1 hypothetical protein [Verrucomicrobiota bacterium]